MTHNILASRPGERASGRAWLLLLLLLDLYFLDFFWLCVCVCVLAG